MSNLSNLYTVVVFGLSVLFIVIIVLAAIFRRAIGRSFIVVSEVIVVVINVLFVVGCGLAGALAATQNPMLTAVLGMPPSAAGVVGFFLSAIAAFAVSAIFSAVFFLLVRIELNTRLTASYLSALSRSRNGAGQA